MHEHQQPCNPPPKVLSSTQPTTHHCWCCSHFHSLKNHKEWKYPHEIHSDDAFKIQFQSFPSSDNFSPLTSEMEEGLKVGEVEFIREIWKSGRKKERKIFENFHKLQNFLFSNVLLCAFELLAFRFWSDGMITFFIMHLRLLGIVFVFRFSEDFRNEKCRQQKKRIHKNTYVKKMEIPSWKLENRENSCDTATNSCIFN